MMATSKSKCDENSSEFCQIMMNLFYTNKMGSDWSLIQTSVIEYEW